MVNGAFDWYTELTNEGTPVKGVPKVFFWKSLYHTVRCCIVLIPACRQVGLFQLNFTLTDTITDLS